MGHGFLKTQRDEWDHLSKNPKALPEKNSRSEVHEVCGLALHEFRELLQMFNQYLDTDFLYYQSCYGGGQHLAQLYRYNTYDRRIIGQQLSLSYPLVAGALAAAPVMAFMPRYQEKEAGSFDIATNLPRFFELLSDDNSSLESILQSITPTIPTTHDLHAISATPLLLPPYSDISIPIDVTQGTEPNRPYATRAGIMHLCYDTVRSSTKPLVVRDTRALLVTPFHIPRSLELYAYKPPPHIARTLPTLAPALISVIPGNAIHHFKTITAHGVGLRNFLLQSCMQLMGRKHKSISY